MGRERFRVVVDAANTARLEFLDETGKVVYALPEGPRSRIHRGYQHNWVVGRLSEI
jgi:hypothetical protein